MDFKAEILKSIQTMIDRKAAEYKADRTYRSVILRAGAKGFTVLDETGSERIVGCSIPDVHLSAGQKVWVKEPCGDLNGIHICGIL
ncbi:MAG: hypothetical protein NC079_00650 [Clostridium sp.]|nr:hypothetical protein [Acetatifactor muris]MCM1527454.1 hypothetical protein [Bacteroides sp.]MCM1562100.1 hypothetical protein [Clostridium sp.]